MYTALAREIVPNKRTGHNALIYFDDIINYSTAYASDLINHYVHNSVVLRILRTNCQILAGLF